MSKSHHKFDASFKVKFIWNGSNPIKPLVSWLFVISLIIAASYFIWDILYTHLDLNLLFSVLFKVIF